MSEHTPGPWEYRPEPFDDWGVVRVGRYWICQAKDPAANSDEIMDAHRAAKTDPWEANARLIAAAPDLLDALRAMRQRWDLYTGGIGGAGNTDDRLMQMADAAIAKATPGGPQ